MGRHSLRIIVVLGALVTLVGGTGIFAVFTDRATTGYNSVGSGPRAQSADLAIAEGDVVAEAIDCGSFSEDLATNLFSVADVQPGDPTISADVCLINNGSGDLAITANAIDLNDEDEACTGDEEEAGDTTCGGFQAGELGSVLAVQIDRITCATNASEPIQSNSVVNWTTNPVAIPGEPLAPGEIACLRLLAFYPSTTAETSIQLAQSDRVQWRFAFDGTAVE